MEASTNYFSEMPSEIKQEIFSYLSVADMGRGQQVCKEWKSELEEPTIWQRFYNAIQPKHSKKYGEIERKTLETMKVAVIEKINIIKEIKVKSEPHVSDQVRLMNFHFKFPNLGLNFFDEKTFNFEEIMFKLKTDKRLILCRDDCGRIILKKYKHDLQKVVDVIPSLYKHSISSNRLLFRILGKLSSSLTTIENKKLFYKALEESKNFSFFSPFIVDLAETLEAKGEHEFSREIRDLFPETFAIPGDIKCQAAYYIAMKRLDEAENIAKSIQFPMIANGYERYILRTFPKVREQFGMLHGYNKDRVSSIIQLESLGH